MIYFHNPHFGPFYGRNVFNVLTGRFDHRKYWFLGEHILAKAREGTGILINLDQNSFAMTFVYKFPPLNRLVTLLEVAVWLFLNRVNPFRVPLRFSAASLTEKDVVLVFAYDNMQREKSLLSDVARSRCVKVVHLTHYLFQTARIAAHSEKMEKRFFAAENDLSACPYFRSRFPYYRGKVYLLPFVPQERFRRLIPFRERRLKCLALGTLTLLRRNEDTADFMDHFNTDCVHPMRKAIYENREKIGDFIDSSVGLSNTDGLAKDVHSQRSRLYKAYCALWNLLKANKRAYYSFSATDRFNQYAMAVIPEELNNLPGISWVEAMACGCAYLGIDDPMYTDLGLVPGEHYIAYDNTLEGLLRVVEKYQRDAAALERIAENGYNFVRERLSGEKAAELFISDLRRLAAQAAGGVPPQRLEFRSSFVGGPP